MRIVVIGGGTAGYMAAAQVSRFFPAFELYHVYDSRIPSIGVGEGTLPAFRTWIDGITGATVSEIQEVCRATKKFGVCFENWGVVNRQFTHDFGGGKYAYHLSAARLPSLLQPIIRATHLDKRVLDVHSTGRSVRMRFEDGVELEADFAFDARGFPKTLDQRHQTLPEIPTNAALIRRGPALTVQEATRSVARPHGWIFVIPLTSHTSYGYIYNETISRKREVQADFDRFLEVEKVAASDQERDLRFPSFAQRTFFDGAVFKIGNAASFLEPLEATAIGVILLQLRVASYWLADGFLGVSGQEKWDAPVLKLLNQEVSNSVRAIGLFVGWHYAKGSPFDTPFWRFARANFEQTAERLRETALFKEFEAYVEAGVGVSVDDLQQIRDPRAFEDVIRPNLKLDGAFGGFSELSFAQVGRGIGYYTVP